MSAKHHEILKEEWSVFELLFSEELIQKVTNKNLSEDEQRNIILALNSLGFAEICDEIISKSHVSRPSEIHVKGIPEIDINQIAKICSLFINEIKSPNLQKIFISSVASQLKDYDELNRSRIS